VSACGLLGVQGARAEGTEIRTAALGYTEPDRVSAFEAIGDVDHTFGDGKSANLHVVYDALTGASASGATPAPGVQTFTTPSGRGEYTTAPGETPLDDTFHDARVALSGGVTLPFGRVNSWSAGLYGSTEHDYSSLGVNTSLSRDFDRRNRTLAVRLAYFADTINPEGGRPIPLAEMARPGRNQPRLDGDGSKDVLDLGLSLTQVIDRLTVAYLGYTYSHVTGYQTDPYKILSQVDAQTGAPDAYLFEKRPDARDKHVVFGRLVRRVGAHDLQASYRFMTDDWGIASHMAELRLRLNTSARNYFEPHVRYYIQSAADFYHRYLVAGEPLPDNASADYRLGDMDTYTVGLRYGHRLREGHELTARFEYYAQTGDSHPPGTIAPLRDFDLFPTVEAFIVQLGYSVAM